MRLANATAAILLVMVNAAQPAAAEGPRPINIDAIGKRLARAYPEVIDSVDATHVIFKDGTRLPLDDGLGEKNAEDWLNKPDIEDMFRFAYGISEPASQPSKDHDPGRARNEPFFLKLYGDCKARGFETELAEVTWLPKKSGQTLKISKRNGVAARLQAVSNALDQLPPSFDRFLVPSAGTFNCRSVAGTNNRSAHAYAIAIDISTKHAHYWRWAKGGSGDIAFKNEIPVEIVRIFEREGFIWGGRWYHYDTMHFEYRPELLPD